MGEEVVAFDAGRLTVDVEQHLKNIDSIDEIVSCRSIVGIASIYRSTFVHIVNIPIEQAANLKNLWDYLTQAMNAAIEMSIKTSTQTGQQPSSQSSNSDNSLDSMYGKKIYASMKAIEMYLKVVLVYAPYGINTETGKPKAALWSLDAKTMTHPLLDVSELHVKCDYLIQKVLQWSSNEIFGSSLKFKLPEILCIHSCISSIALTSPYHYKQCADTLCRTLSNYKRVLSENDNIDIKIRKYNFKQTQKQLSIALAGGESALVEDDDDDRDVIQYYQFLMVLNSIKNYATLLIRYGRSGVRMLKLTPHQEGERFKSCDALANTLASHHGMSSQIMKMLPGYKPSQELVGVVQPSSTSEDAGTEQDSSSASSSHVSSSAESSKDREKSEKLAKKKLDPRRKNLVDNDGQALATSSVSKTPAPLLVGLDSESAVKTLSGKAVDPLSCQEMNRFNHEAWTRVYSYGDMHRIEEMQTNLANSDNQDFYNEGAKSRNVKQYFRKSSHHSNQSDQTNGFQKFSLQLGNRSMFREAALVKLAMMNDMSEVSCYHGTDSETPVMAEEEEASSENGHASELFHHVMTQSSYLNSGILDNVLRHYAHEIELLLTILFEVYEKEIRLKKQSNAKEEETHGSIDHDHLTYECMLMKIIKYILESVDKSNIKFRLLKKLILECPYIPPTLPFQIASLCTLYSGMLFRDTGGYGYGYGQNGDAFLKTGLNLLKVISTERGGPIRSRLAAIDASLQLATCGHVLIPLSQVGHEIYLYRAPYPSIHTIDPSANEEGYGDEYGDEYANYDENGNVIESTSSASTSSSSSSSASSALSSSGGGVTSGSIQYNESLITDSVGKESIRKQCIKMVSLIFQSSDEMKPLLEHRMSLMLTRLGNIASLEIKRKEVEREKALSGGDKVALVATQNTESLKEAVASLKQNDEIKNDNDMNDEQDEVIEDDEDEEEEDGDMTRNKNTSVVNQDKSVFFFTPLANLQQSKEQELLRKETETKVDEPSKKKQKSTSSWAKATTKKQVPKNENEMEHELNDFDIDIIQTRCLLELPIHLSVDSSLLFKQIFNLYASVISTSISTSTALSAAANAARAIASSATAASVEIDRSGKKEYPHDDNGDDRVGEADSEELLLMNRNKQRIEAEVSSAVNNAKRLFPQVPGFITQVIEKHVDVLVKFLDNDYSKLFILRELSKDATPLILLLFAKIAASETLSPSVPKAVELLNFALTMETTFQSPNIRFIVPFLGACDRSKFAMVLPRLLPWTSDDLQKAIESGNLANLTARTPGPPLSIAEFERAVSYRIQSAGSLGSEQANSSAAELIELLIRLGGSEIVTAQSHMMRCLNTAFNVLLSLDKLVSVSAIQRVLMNMPQEKPTPLYFMRFLLECSKYKPALSQFICTQVIPTLIQHQVWSEKERWQGFLLLTKKYTTMKPPHCLQALLSLPPPQLEQLLAVNSGGKDPLASFVRLTYGGNVNAAYGSGMASINNQTLKLLGIC